MARGSSDNLGGRLNVGPANRREVEREQRIRQAPSSLITDEIVDRAWAAALWDLDLDPDVVRGTHPRFDKTALRAALEAVEGDIVEEFGASGCKPPEVADVE